MDSIENLMYFFKSKSTFERKIKYIYFIISFYTLRTCTKKIIYEFNKTEMKMITGIVEILQFNSV